MMKKENGITLIALVITIAVLLILAGITLFNIFGENGIIAKAKSVKYEAEKAEISDMLKVGVSGIRANALSEEKEEKYYYTDLNTFLISSKFNACDSNNITETQYIIWEYKLNEETNKVNIKISKNKGTGKIYEYEIDILTGYIKIVGEDDSKKDDETEKTGKIIYKKLEDGQFENEPITEYTEGTIVGFSIPIREGYEFEGWYQTETYEGEKISRTTKEMTGNITLYAKWIKESNLGYFTYNNNILTGLTEEGKTAYDTDAEDMINLVIPKKTTEGIEITQINANIFKGYTKIKKVVIGKNITSLGSALFNGCTGIEKLTIPISLDSGKPGAFSGCTGILEVYLTTGTGERLDYRSVNDYTSYTRTPWYQSRDNEIQVTLEEGITKIGAYTFNNCTGLKFVELPVSIAEIGIYAFNNCTGMLGEINIGQNVTTIGAYAFNGCTGIRGNLVIPEEVTTIANYTFANTSIETIVIPENVTKLGDYAFQNCKVLTRLTMPISLDSGRPGGFLGCTGITEVYLTKGTGEGLDYRSVNDYTSYTRTPWYQSRENEIQVTLEEGITKIGAYTFNNCTGLKLVELPVSIAEIGMYAFNNCTGMLGEINIGQNVTTIGAYAFNGCTGIRGNLVIPEEVTTIANYTFANTSIETIVIPENVTKLGDYAFQNCKVLTRLTIPISLDSGKPGTFLGCTAITEVYLTKGTGEGLDYRSVNDYTSYTRTPWYQSRDNEIQVTLEEGITKIGAYTFNNCTGLKFVELPVSIAEIGIYAFNNCTGMLGEINIGQNVTTIGAYAFNGCTGIRGNLVIPEEVTTIANYTFANTSIETIVIPENVTKLGDYAFQNCKVLTRLTMPISLDSGRPGGFLGCIGITEVYLTKGTGERLDYRSVNDYTSYTRTPWYQSKENEMKIIISKDITSIGNYTFYNLTNATFYYEGSESEWANVSIGTANTSLSISGYNYKE